MAVLHRKEEKIQVVLGRLPKKYTHEQFVEMFIKLYSKDWGKIKSAYIKQSQDKDPGTIINMPKPEIYLKQILGAYLQQADIPKAEAVKTSTTALKKETTEVKKLAVTADKEPAKAKKANVIKKIAETELPVEKMKAAKAPAKKKAVSKPAEPVKVKKPEAATKK